MAGEGIHAVTGADGPDGCGLRRRRWAGRRARSPFLVPWLPVPVPWGPVPTEASVPAGGPVSGTTRSGTVPALAGPGPVSFLGVTSFRRGPSGDRAGTERGPSGDRAGTERDGPGGRDPRGRLACRRGRTWGPASWRPEQRFRAGGCGFPRSHQPRRSPAQVFPVPGPVPPWPPAESRSPRASGTEDRGPTDRQGTVPAGRDGPVVRRGRSPLSADRSPRTVLRWICRGLRGPGTGDRVVLQCPR